MWKLKELYLLLLFRGVFGWKKQQIFIEKLIVTYVDPKYADMVAEVYKLNETVNAANATVTFKFDIPPNFRFFGAVFRKVKNDYSMNVFHADSTIRKFTDMEEMGISDLCMKYTKPPAVWPLKKGVTYHSEGWSPDTSKLPANLPNGKWKIQAYVFFPNKTKVAEVNMFTQTKLV